jgi:hypothetical protein
MPIKNRASEVICRFKVGQSAGGLELRAGATPLFSIGYDGGGGSTASATIGDKTVPLSPDRDGVSSVHLFMDGSIIETLIDSKEMMTARCYAPSPGGIQLAWTGAPDVLSSLAVASVTPISNDRLTT